MTISKQQYQMAFWQKIASLPEKTEAAIAQVMMEHLQEGLRHYQDMDEDAKKMVDEMQEKFLEEARQGIAAAEDSPQRRKAQRALSKIDQKHYAFADVLDKVGNPPEHVLPYAEAGERAAIRIFQMIADVLHDGMSMSVKSNIGLAILGVIHDALNAALVGLHAIKHGLPNQAIAMVRTIHENADKAKLFHEQPEWAEFYLTQSAGRVWNELSPSMVRKKLNLGGTDRYHSMFSNIAHTSRGSIKTFMTLEKEEGAERPTITLRVGGTVIPGPMVVAYGWIIFEALRLLLTSDHAFEKRLNRTEMNEMYKEAWGLYTGYLKDHFIPWAKAEGIETAEMEKMVDRALEDIELNDESEGVQS